MTSKPTRPFAIDVAVRHVPLTATDAPVLQPVGEVVEINLQTAQTRFVGDRGDAAKALYDPGEHACPSADVLCEELEAAAQRELCRRRVVAARGGRS